MLGTPSKRSRDEVWLSESPKTLAPFIAAATRASEQRKISRATESALLDSPSWDLVTRSVQCRCGQAMTAADAAPTLAAPLTCDHCARIATVAAMEPHLHCGACATFLCPGCADTTRSDHRYLCRTFVRCGNCKQFAYVEDVNAHRCAAPNVRSGSAPRSRAASAPRAISPHPGAGREWYVEVREVPGSATAGQLANFLCLPVEAVAMAPDSGVAEVTVVSRMQAFEVEQAARQRFQGKKLVTEPKRRS
jgi:hypothetical protein